MRGYEEATVLNAVNSGAVLVPAGGAIPFSSTRISDGCCPCKGIRHEEGSGRFVLLNTGDYQVTFTGTYVIGEIRGQTENIKVSLVTDGTDITGGSFAETVDQKITKNGTAQTIVKVYCNDSVSLSVVNKSDVPLLFTDTGISIVKVK